MNVKAVCRTLSSKANSALASVWLGEIRVRIRPHCIVMMSWSPSLRYGVAVIPKKYRAEARRRQDSTEKAGTW